MIQIRAENTLTIHLINESDSSTNDIRTFHNLIKVCKHEANKPGFTNMFDDEQKNLIRMISKQITAEPDEPEVRVTADRALVQ